MTKTIILGISVAAVLIAGLYAFMPAASSDEPNTSEERDNVIVNSITLADGVRMVIVDNAGIGGTSDVEVTWRFNPNWCAIQTFDGTTFTTLGNDGAFGGNPAHGDASHVQAVTLIGIDPNNPCVINPALGHFVTVSTVGSEDSDDD